MSSVAGNSSMKSLMKLPQERTEISETDLPHRSGKLTCHTSEWLSNCSLKFLLFFWTFDCKSSLEIRYITAIILIFSIIHHSAKWISLKFFFVIKQDIWVSRFVTRRIISVGWLPPRLFENLLRCLPTRFLTKQFSKKTQWYTCLIFIG